MAMVIRRTPIMAFWQPGVNVSLAFKMQWSYGSVEERSVHTGKVAGSIPARTTNQSPPYVRRTFRVDPPRVWPSGVSLVAYLQWAGVKNYMAKNRLR